MIGSKVLLELARYSDAVEIANLSKEYIEYGLRWRYTPEKILRIIRTDGKNLVVARKRDKLVGFGIMTYGDETANLDLLAVKTLYRRRGVGRQIVNWLEEVALTAGIFSLFVQVRKLNSGAIKFYEKLGFEIIEERSGYYQGKENGILLKKVCGNNHNFRD